MILDSELAFGTTGGAWAPTAVQDNYTPNVLDTGPLGNLLNTNAGRDLGPGEDLFLEILVTQTVTSAGAATVMFGFETSAASAMTSPTVLVTSAVIPKATLVAGYYVHLPIPRGTYLRYVAPSATIGTAVLTAGQFQAQIVKSVQDSDLGQPGFSVK